MDATSTPRLDIVRAASTAEIKEGLFAALARYADRLPHNKKAMILLKPNLNSNMNALTGNTTDLRLISAVIQYLQANGFANIVIGEGTNSGFYRNRIGVIARLKIDALAKQYGVKMVDLNYEPPFSITFEDGVQAGVAQLCRQADFFINMPKLKTHFEVGMSVCLKNLMGCLVGQENKKKTHRRLAANILQLNRQVQPDLHIVDALIAMEGLGPTRGTPVRLDRVIVGTHPLLVDMACARIAGVDYRKVATLALAEQQGLITPAQHRFIEELNLEPAARAFAPPRAGWLARFIHSPVRQQFFLKIRNTKLFSYLAATDWFGRLLFMTGLRQEVFLKEEMACKGLYIDHQKCGECDVCRALCPMGLDPVEKGVFTQDRCIQCLYCFSACPYAAIDFEGSWGFFEEQIKQYDGMIRSLYKP